MATKVAYIAVTGALVLMVDQLGLCKLPFNPIKIYFTVANGGKFET